MVWIRIGVRGPSAALVAALAVGAGDAAAGPGCDAVSWELLNSEMTKLEATAMRVNEKYGERNVIGSVRCHQSFYDQQKKWRQMLTRMQRDHQALQEQFDAVVGDWSAIEADCRQLGQPENAQLAAENRQALEEWAGSGLLSGHGGLAQSLKNLTESVATTDAFFAECEADGLVTFDK